MCFAAMVLACRDAARMRGSVELWTKRKLVLGINYALVFQTLFYFLYIYFFFPFVIHWKTYLGDFAFVVIVFFFFFFSLLLVYKSMHCTSFLGDLCC